MRKIAFFPRVGVAAGNIDFIIKAVDRPTLG
jgi:hypothetical protein